MDNKTIQCPLCKSQNLELINTHHLIRKYTKCISNIKEEGINDYPFCKYLCLDCGMIFESMNKDILKQYKIERPFLQDD